MSKSTREEIYEELKKSGFAVGIKLPITVMPILKADYNEEDHYVYLLTLDEIPALQGLSYSLEQALITLKICIEEKKNNLK